MASALKVLVNGDEKGEIAVSDRGLNYGDGLFETIAVFFGIPELLLEHLQRLLRGCEQLKIPFNDWNALQSDIEQLASSATVSERAVIKVIITRGSGGRGYQFPEDSELQRIVMLSPWPERPETAAKLRFCGTPLGCNPALAGIKHLNRLEQVLARAEWGDNFDEGLMSNLHGDVIEGTMSNIFIVKDGGLRTPDLNRCGVEGIMRQHVIQLAKDEGINTKIWALSSEQILAADEIFITNSLMGIRPVALLESNRFPTGPVTIQLMALLQEERG
ncbi:MAG: aminodeoxychorismate lyase [Gammaproteobacteria bacterium]|nr:aminodeoxychorismate lyase [Gammaproteobacteria bacterium]